MRMTRSVTVVIGTLQMMASPADLEHDRKAEEERRVQDVLAYLDEDEREDGMTGDRSLLPSLWFSLPALSIPLYV